MTTTSNSSRFGDSEGQQAKATRNEPEDAVDDITMEVEGDDGRAYVVKYSNTASFPLEIGDTVWVKKPGYRAPLGEFRIVKAHPQNMFELVVKSTGVAHSELVEGRYIMRT